jgi:anti-sigma regulatory factor (Ser/Thr protein kinase)
VADPHPFRLPNDLSEVPPLRDLFAKECEVAGVLEEDREASKLVFTELVNNAIEHGCTAPEHFIEGWYRITDTDIEFEVTDPSRGLSAADFDNCDPTDFAEEGRGAGLYLIKALTDEVHVGPSQSGGTTVRIVKHRTRGAA